MKKEANFFGDIVIVPFADSYDLVVLKTVAICEYAVCSKLMHMKNHITLIFHVSFWILKTLVYVLVHCFCYTCPWKTRVVSAKYIMKCDDDTFVRLDSVMADVRKIPYGKSFYLGNINYYHRPLREGKWAVSFEVISVEEQKKSLTFKMLLAKAITNLHLLLLTGVLVCGFYFNDQN